MVLPTKMDIRLERSRIGRAGRDILCGNRISVHVERRRERMERRNEGPLGSRIRRLGQHTTPGSRSARERTVDDHDFSFWHSTGADSPELVTGDCYRINIAEYQGKVTAVKVYEGPNAKEQIEADIALNKHIRHHAIVRYINSCTTVSPPFAIFDSVISGSESRDPTLTDLNSLPCYLAGMLRRGEKDSLIAGAQLMRDVASGLDHISKCLPLSGITLDLFVNKDKICISLGAGKLGHAQDDPGGHLVVYHKLCHEAFWEANRECHFDRRKVVNNFEDSETKSDHDSDSDSEFPLDYIKVVEDECKLTRPRREYAFVPVDNLSLREISADCSSFISQLDVPMSGVRYLHRLQRNARRATPVRHRCLGYIRQEVTLSTSVSDSAIISHRTPSLQEICRLIQSPQLPPQAPPHVAYRPPGPANNQPPNAATFQPPIPNTHFLQQPPQPRKIQVKPPLNIPAYTSQHQTNQAAALHALNQQRLMARQSQRNGRSPAPQLPAGRGSPMVPNQRLPSRSPMPGTIPIPQQHQPQQLQQQVHPQYGFPAAGQYNPDQMRPLAPGQPQSQQHLLPNNGQPNPAQMAGDSPQAQKMPRYMDEYIRRELGRLSP
ncbi:hypothetical protein C8J56DRAFT_1159713 [Mycena floridula]|nr:hypothetical protein C8J56DRAFT_1159713 [Mycena floridula]